MSERAARTEEGIEIITRCWQESGFNHEGRFWNLRGVDVQPKPVQQPRPRIVMGGSSVSAARRAARIADGFAANHPEHAAAWRDEMQKLGRDPGPEGGRPSVPPGVPTNFLLVARDAEGAWLTVAPHALYESNTYARWSAERGSSPYAAAESADELRRNGTYGVLTPEETASRIADHEDAGHTARLVLHPMMGGMPFALGQEGLELVVDEVVPALEGR